MTHYYASKLVKGTIRRKSMLYKTYVEYGDYAMTHVKGCNHGCLYCYSAIDKIDKGHIKSYQAWREPYLVENTLELLSKELPKLKNEIQSVTLSFNTDPFMYLYPEIATMSMNAIALINSYGIKCRVLTKGVLPYQLSNLSKDNEYGITLISLDPDFCSRMEPGAAPITSRIHALRALHDAHCRTFVSIEPFMTPNIHQTNLLALMESISFVDKIIFGKLNHIDDIYDYPYYREFYNEKVREVISFCQARGIEYHIKEKTFTPYL